MRTSITIHLSTEETKVFRKFVKDLRDFPDTQFIDEKTVAKRAIFRTITEAYRDVPSNDIRGQVPQPETEQVDGTHNTESGVDQSDTSEGTQSGADADTGTLADSPDAQNSSTSGVE